MSQLAYEYEPGTVVAGLIDGTAPRTIETLVNKSAGAMPFGIAIKENAERSGILLAAVDDKIVGIVAHEHLEATSGDGSAGVPVSKAASVLRKGRIAVVMEDTIAIGGAVYVRHTANGAGKLQLGAFAPTADSGNCRQVLAARVVQGCTGAGVAVLDVDFLTDSAILRDNANLPGVIVATAGAKAGNDREVACALKDANGAAITDQRPVYISTLAVTDNKGDLAAAGTPVGAVIVTKNPATGQNLQAMTPTAAGLFSFKVTNDVAEAVACVITAEGCRPKVLNLSFA